VTVEYLVNHFSVYVSVSKVLADTTVVVKSRPENMTEHEVVVEGGCDLIRALAISIFKLLKLLVAQKRDAKLSTSVKLLSKPHTLLRVIQPF
jgi:hypothetical protein